MSQQDLGSKAADEARDIENADSVEDTQLTSDDILDVTYSVGLAGSVSEITVKYGSRNATIAVDLYAGALTAYEGWGDSHRTHIRDDKAEDILEQARQHWELCGPTEVDL